MNRDRLIQAAALLLLVAATGASGGLLPRLNDLSRDHVLRYTDAPLENAPPFVALGRAIGAVRGIIVDYLWIKVHLMKEKGLYYEIMADSELITKLQPRFAAVWAFLGHNMAYNISVTHNTAEERWEWVQKGINLVRNQGLRYNPNDLQLHRELAFWFLHKIEGVSDDAHFQYKTELAREWHDVLGEPPYDRQERIAWIKAIADAPDGLDEAERRTPGVKGLVERLRAGLTPYQARFRFALDRGFLRLVARREALVGPERDDTAYGRLFGLSQLMTAPDEQIRADLLTDEIAAQRGIFKVLDQAASSPESKAAWETLVAMARKRVLVDEYNMDARLMYEYTRDYGPLDWRHGSAHALYWALRGTSEAEYRTEVNEEDVYRIVNNDRTKLHAMQDLARFGRVGFDPYASDLPSRLPDPRWIESIDRYWEELSIKHKGTRGPGPDMFRDFHRNFLSSAVRELYRSGEIVLAQKYLDRLDSLYGSGDRDFGDPRFSLDLDTFVWTETREEYLAQPHVAPSDVAASLRYAFLVGVGDQNKDVLERALKFAWDVTDWFRTSDINAFETPKTGHMRLADMVATLETSVRTVFGQLLVDRSVPLLKRLLIYNRAGLMGRADLQREVYDDVRPYLQQEFQASRLAGRLQFDAVFAEPPGMDAFRLERAAAMERQAREREAAGAQPAEIERR